MLCKGRRQGRPSVCRWCANGALRTAKAYSLICDGNPYPVVNPVTRRWLAHSGLGTLESRVYRSLTFAVCPLRARLLSFSGVHPTPRLQGPNEPVATPHLPHRKTSCNSYLQMPPRLMWVRAAAAAALAAHVVGQKCCTLHMHKRVEFTY